MDQELALGAQTLLHVAAATSDGWAWNDVMAAILNVWRVDWMRV